MTTAGRNHLTSSSDRSPFITERRRKLFPIEDHDAESELGHMSPLCSDSASDSEIDGIDSIVDNDSTDIVQKERVRGDETPVSIKAYSESMSPLTLSPYTSTFFRCTPAKYSPSQNLKTPHDTSTKPVLQKEQKTLLEESKSLKRKSSPSSSPEQNKSIKVDFKNSKVRTALFPPEEDVYAALPTKSFYSKVQENVVEKRASLNKQKYTAKNIKLIIGRHGSKHRKKFGQINNGVGHKIRKPKQKKISKIALEKTAKKMLETGSVLNDYMQDLKELRNKQNTESRLIEIPATPQSNVSITKSEVEPVINEYLNNIIELQPKKKLISTPVKQIKIFPEENKENFHRDSRSESDTLTLSSPKDAKSRKFFKSSRAKVTKSTNIQEKTTFTETTTSKVGIDPQEITNESQKITSKVILDNINDFEDEDMEPEANIDNILSVLSNDSPEKQIPVQNKYVQPAEHFENSVKSISNLPQSNSGVFNSQNTMVTQNTEEDMIGVHSKGETAISYFENSCQASFGFNYMNPCNNVLNQNMHGLVDISGHQGDSNCQMIFNNTATNSDAFVTTGSQSIDYFSTSKNHNGPNDFGIASNTECLTTVDTRKASSVLVAADCQNIDSGQFNPIDNNANSNIFLNTKESAPVVNERYNSNTLEPCIVSSQVVFDNMLLEDGTETVTTLRKQDEPFLNVSSGINPVEPNRNLNNLNRITLEAYNSILASENSIQLHESNVVNSENPIRLYGNNVTNSKTPIQLQGSNGVNSENAIQLHRNNVANAILSPISQMCDVTSGLALNSPKGGRKLSPFLSNTSRASKILSFTNCNSVDMERQEQQKLFPVFYPGAKGTQERGEKRERGETVKRSAKKFKAVHEDQMLLDAGQKKFGYTICNECNIVYHMGDPGDEIEHMNYHNASQILRFGGWKSEHLISDFQKNGRIIRVLPTDSRIWLKKVKDLMEFVKRELGCYEMEYDISGSQVYLYIKNRTIAGCAVATVPKGSGHRMLSSLSGVAMCSEESYPIKCGISHIWVAKNFRNQRIASALMDAVKHNFTYGYILTDDDVALTSPTEAGSAFAERYFKTPNYLVYYT